MSQADVSLVWHTFLQDAQQRVRAGSQLEIRGTLTRLTGLVLEAVGIRVPVGSQCWVRMKAQAPVLAEVVGFSNDRAYLMPAGNAGGRTRDARWVEHRRADSGWSRP